MKNLLLLSILLFQLTNSYGQCTTTETVERNTEIVNIKCTNGGYLPPNGYEWMKKAVLWHKIPVLGAGIDGINYDVGAMTDYTSKGNTLTDAISRYQKNMKIWDGRSGDEGFFAFGTYLSYQSKVNDLKSWNVKTFGKLINIDCNLGYVAYVQLIDGFYRDGHDEGGAYAPNQSFGYSCGQPTPEAALKIAWEVARKSLGKPAAAFSFYTTINTEPKDETSEGNRNIDCFVWTGSTENNERNIREISKHPDFPDNADGFVNYIKNDLESYVNNRPNKYTAAHIYRFNNFNLPYPVFTSKIGGSSKQSANAKKTKYNAKAVSTNDANSYLTLGDAAANEGRMVDAKKYYLDAIRSNPNIERAHFNLGVIAYNEAKVEEAEKYYLKSIQLFPNFKEAYLNLSALRLEKDVSLVAEMNKLGRTASENIKYDNLSKKRTKLFRDTAPLLEKYIELGGEDLEVKKTLLGIYEFLGDQPKIETLKQKM